MTMIKLLGEVYQIRTKDGKDYDRMKIYVVSDITGEIITLHDISFKDVAKHMYDVLIELGHIKHIDDKDIPKRAHQ